MPTKEFELITDNLPDKKAPGPDDFMGEFNQTFTEDMKPIICNVLQKIQTEETLF